MSNTRKRPKCVISEALLGQHPQNEHCQEEENNAVQKLSEKGWLVVATDHSAPQEGQAVHKTVCDWTCNNQKDQSQNENVLCGCHQLLGSHGGIVVVIP